MAKTATTTTKSSKKGVSGSKNTTHAKPTTSPILDEITELQLAEFFALDQQRKEHARLADNLKRQTESKVENWKILLKAAKVDELSRGNFRITVRNGQRYVSWKDKFIELAGATKADEIMQKTEPSRVLQVEKVSS